MPGGNPLVELNKMGSTRECISLLPDINGVVNDSDVNDDSSIDDDKDSNIAVDMSETENNSNIDSLGTHEVDESTNSNMFEEDKETRVVDEATLPLG